MKLRFGREPNWIVADPNLVSQLLGEYGVPPGHPNYPYYEKYILDKLQGTWFESPNELRNAILPYISKVASLNFKKADAETLQENFYEPGKSDEYPKGPKKPKLRFPFHNYPDEQGNIFNIDPNVSNPMEYDSTPGSPSYGPGICGSLNMKKEAQDWSLYVDEILKELNKYGSEIVSRIDVYYFVNHIAKKKNVSMHFINGLIADFSNKFPQSFIKNWEIYVMEEYGLQEAFSKDLVLKAIEEAMAESLGLREPSKKEKEILKDLLITKEEETLKEKIPNIIDVPYSDLLNKYSPDEIWDIARGKKTDVTEKEIELAKEVIQRGIIAKVFRGLKSFKVIRRQASTVSEPIPDNSLDEIQGEHQSWHTYQQGEDRWEDREADQGYNIVFPSLERIERSPWLWEDNPASQMTASLNMRKKEANEPLIQEFVQMDIVFSEPTFMDKLKLKKEKDKEEQKDKYKAFEKPFEFKHEKGLKETIRKNIEEQFIIPQQLKLRFNEFPVQSEEFFSPISQIFKKNAQNKVAAERKEFNVGDEVVFDTTRFFGAARKGPGGTLKGKGIIKKKNADGSYDVKITELTNVSRNIATVFTVGFTSPFLPDEIRMTKHEEVKEVPKVEMLKKEPIIEKEEPVEVKKPIEKPLEEKETKPLTFELDIEPEEEIPIPVEEFGEPEPKEKKKFPTWKELGKEVWKSFQRPVTKPFGSLNMKRKAQEEEDLETFLNRIASSLVTKQELIRLYTQEAKGIYDEKLLNEIVSKFIYLLEEFNKWYDPEQEKQTKKLIRILEEAKTLQEKMIAIDQVIHTAHASGTYGETLTDSDETFFEELGNLKIGSLNMRSDMQKDLPMEKVPQEETKEIDIENLDYSKYGICAWCKGIFDRSTRHIIKHLTNEEYSKYLPYISHGICDECKKEVLKKESYLTFETDIKEMVFADKLKREFKDFYKIEVPEEYPTSSITTQDLKKLYKQEVKGIYDEELMDEIISEFIRILTILIASNVQYYPEYESTPKLVKDQKYLIDMLKLAKTPQDKMIAIDHTINTAHETGLYGEYLVEDFYSSFFEELGNLKVSNLTFRKVIANREEDLLEDYSPEGIDKFLEEEGIKDINIELSELDPNLIDPSEWNELGADPKKVQKLVALYKEGTPIKPIITVPDNGRYKVIDGIHRTEAAKALHTLIPAYIIQASIYELINNWGDTNISEWVEKAYKLFTGTKVSSKKKERIFFKNIDKAKNEEEINQIKKEMNTALDFGQLTEDEASIIEFAMSQKMKEFKTSLSMRKKAVVTPNELQAVYDLEIQYRELEQKYNEGTLTDKEIQKFEQIEKKLNSLTNKVVRDLMFFFEDYLKWYKRYPGSVREEAGELQVIEEMKQRLEELNSAFDINSQIIAIDNVINMMHIDFSILMHLKIEYEDYLDKAAEEGISKEQEKESYEAWDNLITFLKEQGKLTHFGSLKKKTQEKTQDEFGIIKKVMLTPTEKEFVESFVKQYERLNDAGEIYEELDRSVFIFELILHLEDDLNISKDRSEDIAWAIRNQLLVDLSYFTLTPAPVVGSLRFSYIGENEGLWAIYKGKIYFDPDPMMTHIHWFETIGLPTNGREFDLVTRGTYNIYKPQYIRWYEGTGSFEEFSDNLSDLIDTLGLSEGVNIIAGSYAENVEFVTKSKKDFISKINSAYKGPVKSILEDIAQDVWSATNLETAKQIILDKVEPSNIDEDDKRKIINNVNRIDNLKELQKYLANSILFYSGMSVKSSLSLRKIAQIDKQLFFDFYGVSLLSDQYLETNSYAKEYKDMIVNQVKEVYVPLITKMVYAEASKHRDALISLKRKKWFGTLLGWEYWKEKLNLPAFKDLTLEQLQELYNKGKWYSQYGGKPWGHIVESLIQLKNNSDTNQLITIIDHINDVEHNTGLMFHDFPRIKEWFSDALEIKAQATPEQLMSYLSKDLQKLVAEDLKLRGEEVVTPKRYFTPLEIIKEKDAWDRLEIAEAPSTPPEILAELAKDKKVRIRQCVAENPNTSPETLAGLAKDENRNVHILVAENPNTLSETLAELAKDKYSSVRARVAENPNTPSETLTELTKDKDIDVRYYADNNPNTPKEVEEFSFYKSLNLKKIATFKGLMKEASLLFRKSSVSNPILKSLDYPHSWPKKKKVTNKKKAIISDSEIPEDSQVIDKTDKKLRRTNPPRHDKNDSIVEHNLDPRIDMASLNLKKKAYEDVVVYVKKQDLIRLYKQEAKGLYDISLMDEIISSFIIVLEGWIEWDGWEVSGFPSEDLKNQIEVEKYLVEVLQNAKTPQEKMIAIDKVIHEAHISGVYGDYLIRNFDESFLDELGNLKVSSLNLRQKEGFYGQPSDTNYNSPSLLLREDQGPSYPSEPAQSEAPDYGEDQWGESNLLKKKKPIKEDIFPDFGVTPGVPGGEDKQI